MAVNKTPVLKRCRSLDLDPTFLGYDKNSHPIYVGDKNPIYDVEPKSKNLSFLGYDINGHPIYKN